MKRFYLILCYALISPLVAMSSEDATKDQEKDLKVEKLPKSQKDDKVSVSKEVSLEESGEKNTQNDAEKVKPDVYRDWAVPYLFEMFKRYHVSEVDSEKVFQGAVKGMLKALDPHSKYLTPQEWKDFQKDLDGKLIGIGIQLVADKGAIRVISPVEDSPAHKAGIKSGDYITKIDGEYIFGLSVDEAIKKLKSETPGTKVTVNIFRDGKNFEKILVREVIKNIPVKFGTFEDVGYVRITTFSHHEVDMEFASAIQDIKKTLGRKLKGIVIDVRANSGGLVKEAMGICNNLLDGGIMVSSKGRNKEDNKDYTVTPTGLTKGIPIVILVDGGSASASEILAGAIQDQKRGLIIGANTFGKGTIQVYLPFGGEFHKDGKVIKSPIKETHGIGLTIARYYTPSGKSIQGEGIIPDIIVEQTDFEVQEAGFDFKEKDYKNSLDKKKDIERKKAHFIADKEKEKKKQLTIVAKKNLDQDNLQNYYDNDYQFRRAIQLVKTIEATKTLKY